MRLGKFIKKSGNDYFFNMKDAQATLIFMDGLNWYIRYNDEDILCYEIKDTLQLVTLGIQFTNWYLINGKDL